ncbi:MAG: hypothetical protein KatS3mg082_1257 [Nitrospiraceae bacterium]|nr:MAG: hypothetical protein KatS3mg082_1257 [Nitrospiraceae bacterium]
MDAQAVSTSSLYRKRDGSDLDRHIPPPVVRPASELFFFSIHSLPFDASVKPLPFLQSTSDSARGVAVQPPPDRLRWRNSRAATPGASDACTTSFVPPGSFGHCSGVQRSGAHLPLPSSFRALPRPGMERLTRSLWWTTAAGMAPAAAVERFSAECQAVRLIRLPANRGKGAAVRKGMLEARGRLLLFTDADGATPIEELQRLEQAMIDGADLAIGSRTLASPRSALTRFARDGIAACWGHSSICWSGARASSASPTPSVDSKLFRRPVAQDLFAGRQHQRVWLRPRTALRRPTPRLSHRGGPGQLGRSARLESPGHPRRPSHGARPFRAIRRSDAQGRYAPAGSLSHAARRRAEPSQLPAVLNPLTFSRK